MIAEEDKTFDPYALARSKGVGAGFTVDKAGYLMTKDGFYLKDSDSEEETQKPRKRKRRTSSGSDDNDDLAFKQAPKTEKSFSVKMAEPKKA